MPFGHVSEDEFLKNESVDTDSDDTLSPMLGLERQTRWPLNGKWRQRASRPETKWKALSLALTLLLIVAVTLHVRHPSSRRPLDVSGYICAPNGAIPAVAEERGCGFDGLSFHWFDREHVEDEDNVALVQEFLGHGPWHRYLDAEGEYEIPADNKVLVAAYLTRREHIIHCQYALRQTHLWVTKGWDVPFNYGHTLHCTQYLVDTIMSVVLQLQLRQVNL